MNFTVGEATDLEDFNFDMIMISYGYFIDKIETEVFVNTVSLLTKEWYDRKLDTHYCSRDELDRFSIELRNFFP